jgi:tRNA threonylcarbamoyladenosine modification (KEOPS) complex  Pcc1 subunit
VKAIGTPGTSQPTALNVATTILYVDNTLAGVTIKADDVMRLRNAVNAVRVAANLGSFNFTDPSLAGVAIKAVHLTQLRAALKEALDILGIPMTFTDGTVTPGVTAVRAAHWLELRAPTQ